MQCRWWWTLTVLAACLPAMVSACECCARNATAAECGPDARLEARADCACCSVCAVEKGGRCDSSDRPCRKGLDCSREGRCTDEKRSCRSDGECASDRFCLGAKCSDPCTILDPCNSSLKNGVCRTRNHRPVCSCPQGFAFEPDQKACVKVGCEDGEGNTIDIGERIFRNSCRETCLCGPTGKFNCTATVCPPGFYLPGTFRDDPDCTELPSRVADGCCVNVICAEPAVLSSVDDDEAAVTSTESPSTDGDSTTTAATTTTTASTTTSTTPATTTPATQLTTTTASFVTRLDMQPLEITHNSTVLQLPSSGGKLNYQAAGGPPKQVPLKRKESVVTVDHLLPGTAYTFSWSGQGGDKTLSVHTRAGCVTNVSSHAIGETYHMGCESTCVCGGPNQPSCRPRCSFTRGTVTDKSCSERPDVDDPECCVQLVCAVTSAGGQIVDSIFDQATTTEAPTTPATSTIASTSSSTSASTSEPASTVSPNLSSLMLDNAPKPTLIVTTKSFNSVTLAWDDFKPQAYERGYVAQYRRSGEEQWRRQELPPQSGQSVPLVKISQLRPATEYQARVSIYDGRSDALGDTTETIRFMTDDGCSYANETYPVGARFYKGCAESCYCELRGRTRCVPRCQRPLFRAGQFSDDPLCFERQQDECCVIVTCASEPTNHSDAAVVPGGDPCEGVHCGENYTCQLMKKDVPGADPRDVPMCVCPDGFTEMMEAEEKKCLPVTTTVRPVTGTPNVTGCTYGNETYQSGETFFDGCDYQCLCNRDEEVECQARCPTRKDDVVLPGCRLMPDPDDECCHIISCEDATPTNGAIGSPAVEVVSTTVQPETTTVSSTDAETTVGETTTENIRAGRVDDPIQSLDYDFGIGSDSGEDLEIVELRPVNADSSTMKVRISETVLDSILSAETHPVLVQWRYDQSAPWMQKNIGIDEISIESLDTLVMTVPGLREPRSASVKVQYDRYVSAEVGGASVVPSGALTFSEQLTTTEAAIVATTQVPMTTTTSETATTPSTTTSTTVSSATTISPAVSSTTETVSNSSTTELAEGDTPTSPPPTEVAGCQNGNFTYAPGEEFFKGCLERCACLPGGYTHCVPRCPSPDASSTAGQECIMVRDERDPCCWVPRCFPAFAAYTSTPDDLEETNELEAPTEESGRVVDEATVAPSPAVAAVTTPAPTNATVTEETTTETPNVIEIDLSDFNDQLTDEEIKALNDAITSVMFDQTSTESFAESSPTTDVPDVETSSIANISDISFVQPTTESGLEALQTTASTLDDTSVVSEPDHNSTVAGYLPTEKPSTNRSSSAGRPSPVGYLPTETTGDGDRGLTETTDNVTRLDGFVDSDFLSPTILTITDEEQPNPEERTNVTAVGTITPLGETDTITINNATRSESANVTTLHSATESAGVSSTTPRTVPTTRRITGLITGMPAEPPESTTTSSQDSDPTEAPRANDLVPQVGIVVPKKKPTLIRVMTVTTTADIAPIPTENATAAVVTATENERAPGTATSVYRAGATEGVEGRESRRGEEVGPVVAEDEDSQLQLTGLEAAFFSPELRELEPPAADRDRQDGAVATVQDAPASPAPAVTTRRPTGGACVHQGATYQPGDEFHDGCEQFCICTEGGVQCAPIRCPHQQGLTLINPDCLEWEMEPEEPPSPPDCCPEVKCMDDGHCDYMGETFRNQRQIPQNLTGCEQRCYCEFGNVTCQPECPPVPAQPPPSLACALPNAELVTGPNGCCKFWQCKTDETTSIYDTEYTERPPSLDLQVQQQDPETVVLSYSIPRHLVGLPAAAEVLYTTQAGVDDDPALWNRRVFETDSSLLDREQYSWTLGDLRPGQQYTVQARVVSYEGHALLESDPVVVQTAPKPTEGTTLPPKVALDAELEAPEINTTWAKIAWRRLTEDELRYIDGIQLRYRDVDVDAQVWKMTPFIHRELTTYELVDLKPGTGYEIDIVLMPFQNKRTEMVSERPLNIRTPPVIDLYDFNVTLILSEATERSVLVSWAGIPQPQYKYVNVYRIVYVDEERELRHDFKLAKTSDQPSLRLKGLKPSSKYQVWLEIYLKNGKKRVSEVQEFVTKPGQLGKAEKVGGLETGREVEKAATTGADGGNSHYSGMVTAAIIAAVALLICLILAALLCRNSRAKAPITPARKNGPSYENPAFKTSDLDHNGANGNDRFS